MCFYARSNLYEGVKNTIDNSLGRNKIRMPAYAGMTYFVTSA